MSWYGTGTVAVGDAMLFSVQRLGYNGGYPNLPPNQSFGGPGSGCTTGTTSAACVLSLALALRLSRRARGMRALSR